MHIYIIMPVSSDPLFVEKKAIIQAEAQKMGLDLYFPLDKKYKEGFDLSSTLEDLHNSQFVIADLSWERPSCYFELGLAQAIDKATILIAEEGTPIHQVYRRNEIIFYRGLDAYRRIIAEAIKSSATNGGSDAK